MTVASLHADEEWQRVAFVGNAEVTSISGLVEVITKGEERIVRKGEKAKEGQTLRIWKGAEVILMMDRSESLVRARGPVLLRLAPASEGYDRACAEEPENGFVTRAVRGSAKFKCGQRWMALRAGMTLPVGTLVRPGRDSILDFYHSASSSVCRVTDSSRPTALWPGAGRPTSGTSNLLAAKAP